MAVHAHATAGATPEQVLTRTDRDLADLNAGRFVSCLYAHLGDSGDLPLHQLVDDLVHHTHRTGRHTDDIALLLRPPHTAER